MHLSLQQGLMASSMLACRSRQVLFEHVRNGISADIQLRMHFGCIAYALRMHCGCTAEAFRSAAAGMAEALEEPFHPSLGKYARDKSGSIRVRHEVAHARR